MISGAQAPSAGLSAAEKGLNSYERWIRGMRMGIADERVILRGGFAFPDSKTFRISLIKHRFANKISAGNPLSIPQLWPHIAVS
jgi:hypothetical protein